MTSKPRNLEGRVEEAVKAAVSREVGFPVSEIESGASLTDDSRIGPSGFYRIIADLEQTLGIHPSEGNWDFDEGTINGIASYYVEILRKRRQT